MCKNLGWELRGKSIIWEGEGINEIGRRADTGEIVIRIDERYFRPTEVEELMGDASKALKKLGWAPKITIEQLVKEMIENDLKIAKEEMFLKNKF